MSVKDVEKLNIRQIETLQRKQGREISRLSEGHDNLKVEMKKANEMELVDLQHENMRQVASENDKKEKVLSQMKHQLEVTGKMTDKQIKDLKDNGEAVRKTEHEKLSVHRDTVKSENDLYLEELGYRLSKEHKKIVNDSQDQLSTLKNAKTQELIQTEDHYKSKIQNQTADFTERFQADGRTQKKIKDDMDRQFKAERVTTNVRQQQDMGKMTNSHNQALEVRDKEFRKGLKAQDEFFEKKYVDTLKVRNSDLQSLDQLNTKVLGKMKSDLKEKLEATVNRADDPFYRFTELRPSLKSFEDRVEIKVEIPEHAKADVQLTLHGKEAIINFNRRYDDDRKEAGIVNKLHKVESFTTRLMTDHHLDPKSVKSTYADGVMTYVVKRA